MKRKTILFLLLFTVQLILFGEGMNYSIESGSYVMQPGVYIEITTETFAIEYEWDDYYIPKVSGEYYITNNNGIHYIHIKTSENSEYTFSIISNEGLLFLVDLETGETYHASKTVAKGGFPILGFFYNFEASSFLMESYGGKTYKYKSSNLSGFDIMEPWVEGVEGLGMGEWIKFLFYYETSSIYIINGFYDPYRPHLFKKNNRVRDLEIIAYDEHNGELEMKFKGVYTLEDNSELQKIQLPEGWTHFKMIIRSVYPGTTYNDTCISGIFTDKRWGK